MKIIILGDTHFGLRNSLPVFYYHYKKFFEFFFDYLIANDITLVVQLGDLFDNRKAINTQSLKHAKEVFFNKLQEHGIELYTLLGNHDIHLKESLLINSPELVLNDYKNVTIFNQPTNISLGNINVDIIPWICKENQETILNFIENSKAKLCFGHFEIKDYPMYKNIETNSGLSRELFRNYELVISGHYHTYSNRDNILYTGTPYQMTWQDYDDIKNFYVYDTEDNTLIAIPNPYTTFHKFIIDDTIPDISELDLENCFVKVMILNKETKYDSFIAELNSKSCYDIKVSEQIVKIISANNSINIDDTPSILNEYIEDSNITIDKQLVKNFMSNLYLESINSGV